MTPKFPAPMFGNKSLVAHEVWKRIGNVDVWYEAFAGTANTTLARPMSHFTIPNRIEVINDINGFMVNVFRAIKFAPKEVAKYVDYPITEIDSIARYQFLKNGKKGFVDKMKGDAEYFCPKRAGWYIWNLCIWIGIGHLLKLTTNCWNKLPELMNTKGILKVLRTEYHNGQIFTVDKKEKHILKWIDTLHNRLRYVKVICGSWERAITAESMLAKKVGIFLDPPYPEDFNKKVKNNYYFPVTIWHACSKEVYKFCRDNGKRKNLRIAVCGYDSDGYEKLVTKHGWSEFKWSASSGFAVYGENEDTRNNRHRERIYFSPHCRNQQRGLL